MTAWRIHDGTALVDKSNRGPIEEQLLFDGEIEGVSTYR